MQFVHVTLIVNGRLMKIALLEPLMCCGVGVEL